MKKLFFLSTFNWPRRENWNMNTLRSKRANANHEVVRKLSPRPTSSVPNWPPRVPCQTLFPANFAWRLLGGVLASAQVMTDSPFRQTGQPQQLESRGVEPGTSY